MAVMEEHRATGRVLDILELLAAADQRGYTLTEIAQKIGAPKSSIFPIIHTLNARRFIQYDTLSGCYSIGIAAYTVGSVFATQHSLLDHLRDEMKRVTEKCGEICQLGIPDGDHVIYVAKEDTPSPIHLSSYVGKRFPMYCTALGKAFLMEYSPEKRLALYPDSQKMKALTAQTVTDRDTLFRQLDDMKQQGFAMEAGENLDNVCCFATPLLWKGDPVAALSVSIPYFRRTEEKLKIIFDTLAEAKCNIETLFQSQNLTAELEMLLGTPRV